MNLQTYKTTLSKSNQTAVPAWIIEQMGLTAGDNFIWNIEEDKKTLKIIPIPTQKMGDFLSGLGKEVWEGVNVEKYIKDGRQDRVF